MERITRSTSGGTGKMEDSKKATIKRAQVPYGVSDHLRTQL